MALAQAATVFWEQTLKQHQQPKDPFGVRRATDRSHRSKRAEQTGWIN